MPVGLCLRLGIPSGLDRSCSLSRSRRCPSPPPGQELCSPGAPGSRAFPYGRRRDLSGSLATPPAPLPCSETPAEPVASGHVVAISRCCPRTQHGEGFGAFMISRLPQGFSARCLRFTNAVAVAHAKLASGWRAPPLPGGRRTLWVTMKGFRSHPSSFPGLTLTQAGRMRGASSLSWPTSRRTLAARLPERARSRSRRSPSRSCAASTRCL